MRAPESMQHTHTHICLAFVIVGDCDGDCDYKNSISIVCLDYAVVLSNEKTSSRVELNEKPHGGQGAAVLRLGAAVNKSDEAKAVRTVERHTERERGRERGRALDLSTNFIT